MFLNELVISPIKSNVKKPKHNKTTEILRHRHFNVDGYPSTGLRNLML